MSNCKPAVEYNWGNGDEIEKLKYNNDTQNTIKTLNCGDTHVAVQLWTLARKLALDSSKIHIIPVAYAAKTEDTPQKPPPMKYKDLPIYESPHYEYKDYVADSDNCPNYKVKICQAYLFPTVSRLRHSIVNSVTGMRDELIQIRKELCQAYCQQKKDFKKFMRAPENLNMRRAIVGAGTLTGFYAGSGSKWISKRFIFASVGALATGALCFPDETDEIFRNTCWNLGKFAICVFNFICDRKFALRERLPCKDELPAVPPPRPAHQVNKCEKKNE